MADCSHGEDIWDTDGAGAGSNVAKQNELHATHTCVDTYVHTMATHSHEGSVLYHVAMKHDTGRGLGNKTEGLQDPEGNRGAMQPWPRTYR